jgi:hypothetical protein
MRVSEIEKCMEDSLKKCESSIEGLSVPATSEECDQWRKTIEVYVTPYIEIAATDLNLRCKVPLVCDGFRLKPHVFEKLPRYIAERAKIFDDHEATFKRYPQLYRKAMRLFFDHIETTLQSVWESDAEMKVYQLRKELVLEVAWDSNSTYEKNETLKRKYDDIMESIPEKEYTISEKRWGEFFDRADQEAKRSGQFVFNMQHGYKDLYLPLGHKGNGQDIPPMFKKWAGEGHSVECIWDGSNLVFTLKKKIKNGA